MEDQLISFETAKLAKEKGFDIPSYRWYYSIDGLNGKEHSSTIGKSYLYNHSKRGKLYYLASTQSLLQKWLREKYNLHITISVNQFGYGFMYSVVNSYRCECIILLTGGPNHKFTYEEALEAGLEEALKLI